MQAALRGLMTDLDPHSAYLDKEQAQGMDEFANGSYDGVGVELVQLPDRSLRVIAPIDGTPAARAGLLPGVVRSEEHTSVLQSLMRISYTDFRLKNLHPYHHIFIPLTTRHIS